MTTDPREIYQDWLDRCAVLLWEEDFERAADLMVYPHRIDTSERGQMIESREDLIQCAASLRQNLHSLMATSYFRVCREARYVAPDRIEGHHTTYILRGATPVTRPFENEMTLRLEDGEWKGAGLIAQVRNADLRINTIARPSGTHQDDRKETR
ncbi:hypothetical protein [Jannaschia aquimarina]|uniref:SnoaL-like domain-containing protein n=1 Tax=Jannaschia aquimarina TaxID=935700 RepID=A0A0D1DDU3_9RHOB|nr:hypothetical protein [Jannaschia aquimarina]KIT18143.1 hypothetical protein jaqu_00770 [Jannaschia aquimarina]SNT30379.1 hypothetical protein SAMN05421775_110134 [Jannaschia aquimarina]